MREHTVGEVMTRTVVTTTPGTPAQDAARLFGLHRISAVPVLDGEDRVVGVVSRTDVEGAIAGPIPRRDVTEGACPGRAAPSPPAVLTVRDLMTSPAVTVHPEQRVKDAARVMERRGVGRLPVVDPEDRLIGLTTRRDLLRVFLRTDEEVRADVHEALRRTPGGLIVSVREGLVTLTGTAPPDGLSGLLVASLWGIDGVTGVINALDPPR
ncbi:CBS domain-containing protein [Streptomyces sp. NPDC059452]|uniref:CBS domain-containing protein n=1 Tax=Streptomyces sp. NPDC059452 TaxID=3346835 RepID=UPI0036BA8833